MSLPRRPLPATKPSLSTCWLGLRCSPPPPTPRRPASWLPPPLVLNDALSPPVGAAARPPPSRRRPGPRARAPRRPTPVRMRRTLPQLRRPQTRRQSPPWPQAPWTSGRAPAVFYYIGARARDAIVTERRRAQGLCLKCLPGGLINACPCPLHPANARDSAAPRCFPYSS